MVVYFPNADDQRIRVLRHHLFHVGDVILVGVCDEQVVAADAVDVNVAGQWVVADKWVGQQAFAIGFNQKAGVSVVGDLHGRCLERLRFRYTNCLGAAKDRAFPTSAFHGGRNLNEGGRAKQGMGAEFSLFLRGSMCIKMRLSQIGLIVFGGG